jgi:hypothetical protein
VNSISIRPYGNVYTLDRFEQDGKTIEDLVKIPNPFSEKWKVALEQKKLPPSMMDGNFYA